MANPLTIANMSSPASAASWHALIPHPLSAAPSDYVLRAALNLSGGGALIARFLLRGALDSLLLPPPCKTPCHRDELWRHTCFEVFIAGDGEHYHEYNLASSGCWAAYAFARYRERQKAETPLISPAINLTHHSNHIVLTATLDGAALPAADAGRAWHIGLSAVIETKDGRLSYWALHHPGKEPDFHLRGGFTLCLTAP